MSPACRLTLTFPSIGLWKDCDVFHIFVNSRVFCCESFSTNGFGAPNFKVQCTFLSWIISQEGFSRTKHWKTISFFQVSYDILTINTTYFLDVSTALFPFLNAHSIIRRKCNLNPITWVKNNEVFREIETKRILIHGIKKIQFTFLRYIMRNEGFKNLNFNVYIES